MNSQKTAARDGNRGTRKKEADSGFLAMMIRKYASDEPTVKPKLPVPAGLSEKYSSDEPTAKSAGPFNVSELAKKYAH